MRSLTVPRPSGGGEVLGISAHQEHGTLKNSSTQNYHGTNYYGVTQVRVDPGVKLKHRRLTWIEAINNEEEK